MVKSSNSSKSRKNTLMYQLGLELSGEENFKVGQLGGGNVNVGARSGVSPRRPLGSLAQAFSCVSGGLDRESDGSEMKVSTTSFPPFLLLP